MPRSKPNRIANKLRPLITWLGLLALPLLASAHVMPAQQGTLNLVGENAYVVLSVPVAAFTGVDGNQDGLLDQTELATHNAELKRQFRAGFTLTSGGETGEEGMLAVAAPEEGPKGPVASDYVIVMQQTRFASAGGTFAVRTSLFGTRDAERQISFRARRGEDAEMVVLTPANPDHVFLKDGVSTFTEFVRVGIEHILTGTDHLLFLLTIIAALGSLRQWLGIITVFTLAHSLTLVLAANGLVTVPAGLVEPMIAVSIVGMGLLNFILKPDGGGWPRVGLVFACGLLHGLGFASSIESFGLDQRHALASLIGFNTGIEIGQAAFVASLFALVTGLRALWGALPAERAIQASSALAVCFGTIMIFQRVNFA